MNASYFKIARYQGFLRHLGDGPWPPDVDVLEGEALEKLRS